MKPFKIKSRKKDKIPDDPNRFKLIDFIKSNEFILFLKNIKTWCLGFFFFTGYILINRTITSHNGKPFDWNNVISDRFIEAFWLFFILNIIYILYFSTYYIIKGSELNYRPREVIYKAIILIGFYYLLIFLMPFFKS